MKTRHSRQLEGILCVEKPQDWTSFDVVAKMRGIADCHKIGHGGTLDPMATGVLPLFFGRSAKAMELMPNQQKRYTAAIRFGVTTDTQDCTGTVLSQSDQPVTREALEAALIPLRGTIEQLPPMYSAVWVDGQRLYKLAREGREVERPTRQVTIHRLELLEFDGEKRTCVLDVCCSKGTYIRTLCHDIGAALGCGGMLTALRRTETLGFTEADCHTLDELKAAADEGRFEELLLPVETAFRQYGRIFLSPKQTKMFLDGIRLDTNRIRCPAEGDTVRVYGDGRFLALARIDRSIAELQIIKLFYTKENPNC